MLSFKNCCGALLATIFVLVFASPAKSENGSFSLRWDKAQYSVVYVTDSQANKTDVKIILKVGGKSKRVLNFTESGMCCVEPVRNFFGPEKDAIVLYSYHGSSTPALDYCVMKLIRGGLEIVKSEKNISNGFLRVNGNLIEVWSGVRMWLMYWEKWAVVKELPLSAVIFPAEKDTNDQLVVFRIKDRKVEVTYPGNPKQGLRLKSGHDLLLVRSDINDDSDRIEFEGTVTMTIKSPNTFTFHNPGGECEIRIIPNGDPKGEARLSLVVY